MNPPSESKICLKCKKVFTKKYNYSRKYWSAAKYCSPRCGSLGKHNKLGKTGYKHSPDALLRIGIASKKRGLGLSTLNRQIINCYRYRQWRSDVFTRDDFSCLVCGVRGGVLEAHHIKASALIRQENKITSLELALACEELWNLNNGMTLCKKCHTKTDNYAKGLKHYSR